MMMNIFNKKRSGFTIIEMIMGLVVVSVIAAGFARVAKKIKEAEFRKHEYTYAIKFEEALKSNFNEIINVYSVATTGNTANINSRHGWSTLNSSSPFPTFAGGTLTYSLDTALLSAPQIASMNNSIDESLRDMCYFVGVAGVNRTYSCPRINSMVSTNTHVPGTDIDPASPPVFTFVYRRESPSGAVNSVTYTRQPYTFSFNDEYEKRRRLSIERFTEIREGLKSFYNMRLAREINNKPTQGLNSNDDVFVPWQWLLLSPNNMASVVGLDCDTVTNGGSCFPNADWNVGSSFTTINMINRVVDKVFKGEGKYLVDGFNNMIHIHLLYNTCTKGTNTATCVTVSPRMPQKDYSGTLSSPGIPAGVVTPPFTGTIFINTPLFGVDSSLANEGVAEYGRIYFVF